jgi:hypothetical protein
VTLPTLHELEQFAPIITATIAAVAAFVALASISVQKGIARKRAAIDFFLKTEMDSSIVAAYVTAEKAIKALKQTPSMEEFAETDDYAQIRAYLNIHELMAVGIANKVLDDGVCYHYWSAILARHCKEADLVIRHAGSLDSSTYTDLKKLNARWEKKLEKWRKANPVGQGISTRN